MIIETALNMTLPVVDTTISKEIKKIGDQASKKIREGNYEEAIDITLSGLNKFPRNFKLQSNLASLLGDCAEIIPSPLKERMTNRSKQLFKKLMNETAGQPKTELYYFKNEYYYRFGMYREQYELGLLEVSNCWGTDEWESTKGFNGYYSQGVGASNYARQLLEAGNKQQALEYAQKALVAWAQYFTYSNNYYNAYVHYAMALGILGFKNEMMKALSRSASLIKQDLNYYEFKEVIDFIKLSRT